LSSSCTAGEFTPVRDAHDFKVLVKCLEFVACREVLPGGVSQTPPHLKFDASSVPAMANDLIHVPLGVLWGAKVVRVDGASVGKQSIVIRLMRPKQVHMEPGVNSSFDEF